MIVFDIAANNLRRLVRERSNLFFVFALPLLLIVVLGLTVADDEPRIGVHVEGQTTAAAQDLIDGLEQLDGTVVAMADDLGDAVDDLEREDLTALVIVPAGYEQALAAGTVAELEYRVIPGSGGFEVQSLVRSVVADQNATIRASRLVSDRAGLSASEAGEVVGAVDDSLTRVGVTTVDADGDAYVDGDAIGFVAAQELILFVFLMGMIAASALIEARRLGVTRRMLATPATASQIVAGEALGRYFVALLQSAVIVGATAVLFGLDWGSWPATVAIVASFALVATAAALLVGALVDNDSQSSAVGLSLGLALAALGGCMVPFEIFPDWLRTVAHITPHAWAVDAFTEVIQRGGNLGQIGVELGVLTLYGAALLTGGSYALRRSIVG